MGWSCRRPVGLVTSRCSEKRSTPRKRQGSTRQPASTPRRRRPRSSRWRRWPGRRCGRRGCGGTRRGRWWRLSASAGVAQSKVVRMIKQRLGMCRGARQCLGHSPVGRMDRLSAPRRLTPPPGVLCTRWRRLPGARCTGKARRVAPVAAVHSDSMPTSRRPTEERRQQIAEAALRIISGKGVHRLTAQELGREVGIADGTIFRHFKDKAEIVRAAVSHLEGVLFEGFRPRPRTRWSACASSSWAGSSWCSACRPSSSPPSATGWRRLPAATVDWCAPSSSARRPSSASASPRRRSGGQVDASLSADALTLVVIGSLQAAAITHRRSSGKGHIEPALVWRTMEALLVSTAQRK